MNDPNSLQGVTAIIIEDNILVADSMRLALESWDCKVAGMAGTVARAKELIDLVDFDVAILDIDLRGKSVMPVVEAVRAHDKPFLFVSGYGDESVLPSNLRSVQRLNKPVDPQRLAATIREIVAQDWTPDDA